MKIPPLPNLRVVWAGDDMVLPAGEWVLLENHGVEVRVDVDKVNGIVRLDTRDQGDDGRWRWD